MEFDYLIVGSGLTGLILAERLCSSGKKVILVEKQPHVGGILYDRLSKNKIITPRYGLNYFTFENSLVKDYLSQFTDWIEVTENKAIYSEGRLWSLPFDKSVLEMTSGFKCDNDDFKTYIEQHRIENATPQNAEEYILDKFGSDIYNRFIQQYLEKKFDCSPATLSKDVLEDLSSVKNYVPKYGYSRMMNKMIDKCGSNLATLFNSDYFEIKDKIVHKNLIYTGTLDKFFSYGHGLLPYCSRSYREENHDVHYYQNYVQINYPSTEEYTAIIEAKHIFGGTKKKTTILKEFPEKYNGTNIPYYPLRTESSLRDFENYKYLAENTIPNAKFIGRVTDFQNKSNDEVAYQALSLSIAG